MFLIKRNFLCFVLFTVLVSFGCSTQKASIQNDVQLEPHEIPPVEVSEYILGFGDELEISIYRQEDMTRKIRILPDGKIHYPLVGEVHAQGLSVNQLRDKLRERLLKYFTDPKVSVIVTTIGSQKVFVLGEVNKPGVYQLERPKTVVEAVSEAGGFTLDAKPSHVLLIRGGPLNPNPNYRVVEIDKVLTGEDVTQNVALLKEDIIYVPATEFANVERFFERIWTIIPVRLSFIGVGARF